MVGAQLETGYPFLSCACEEIAIQWKNHGEIIDQGHPPPQLSGRPLFISVPPLGEPGQKFGLTRISHTG
jgi:hypothetical protein